ncbi:PMEI domain-containing protein [Heracleum sosnowskyi]|uniref:PMEI domain-containing protein n=1 Tax=Heracleum sosnowskyi TaxID=360622 RepID=A0AAD8M049_9APIA|nr:PMEI domain-containing protein [Heracleum sosnowskyi]
MSSFIFLLSLTVSFTLFASPSIADDDAPGRGTSAAANASDVPNDLITQACAIAPNKDLCQQIINSDNMTPKKDLNDLAFITFEAASTKTVSNIEYITRTSDTADDSSLKQIFQECEEQYEGAIDDVDNSVNYLASRTKDDDIQIDGLMKDAVASIEACQNIVHGKGPKADQLTKMNLELLDMLKNAVAVFHVIK